MLATLETGIEGGKWFRLIDKVWSPKNLARSLEKVVAKGGSAGIDNQSAGQIKVHKDQTIAKLEQELASQYQPQAVKRVWIPKPGSKEKRPLGVPTLRDRIVQGPCSKSLSRSLNAILHPKATGSDLEKDVRTRYAESKNYSRVDNTG